MAQAFQVVEGAQVRSLSIRSRVLQLENAGVGAQVRSLSIRSRFSELQGASLPSGGGRSSPQLANQIALLVTRRRRRTKRLRALKSAPCRPNCASPDLPGGDRWSRRCPVVPGGSPDLVHELPNEASLPSRGGQNTALSQTPSN